MTYYLSGNFGNSIVGCKDDTMGFNDMTKILSEIFS